jgi:ABC-2 type transport system permease protein
VTSSTHSSTRTSTRTPTRPANPPAAAFGRLLRTEAVLFLRTPAAVLFTAAGPLVAFVVLALFPGTHHPQQALGGISWLAAYLPILMAFSIVMAAVNLLPPAMATYREKGILRRFATTPVPPSWLLAAQAAIFAVIGLLVSALLFVAGLVAGVAVPGRLAGFVLTLLLIAAACLGLGVLVAAVARTGKAANAISFALFFPIMFLAGLWAPRATMPGWLRTVSDYSPLGAGVRTLQDSVAGSWPAASGLLVLVAWAVVSGGLAVRLFRWE